MSPLLRSKKRIQAFEFNDLSFVPKAMRDSIIEALGRTLDWGRMLEGLVPELARFYSEARVKEVLDLGAGAGTPAVILARALRKEAITPPKFILTDLYPRVQTWKALKSRYPEDIDFVETPVDATAIDPELSQLKARQIINVLHHFPEPVALGLLQDSIEARSPIFIAEAFRREPLQFLNFAPMGIPSLLLNPLLSPTQRLQKALLTWGSPVLLMASIWDGLVSTLRIYEPEDLMRMIRTCPGHEAYSWRTGSYTYLPKGEGFYLYGVPR